MLRIAVCDDEPAYLEKMTYFMKKTLNERGVSAYHIDTYLSGEALLADCRLKEYQVIFLDIHMSQMDGLKAAKKIREGRRDILLVFVTAFLDYAIEGYRMEAIRFLLKDMLEELLPECMEAVIKKLDLQTYKINKLFREGQKEIAVDRILYVESRGHRLFFHLCEPEIVQYSIYEKLDNIEKELQGYAFLRIHKSFLVNTKYIGRIGNYRVELTQGEVLPVPKEKFQRIKERYYEIMGDLL